jgi:nucleoside-diphosphate-sugar epimerase
MTRTILIAGASGVIGSAALDVFARQPGWRVIALSRRRPVVGADLEFAHLPLDLDDPAACRDAAARLPEVSHLIYAAAAEKDGLVAGWKDPETMALNGQMFANLIDPLANTGHLQHVSLLQGAKAYGAHYHPAPVPLREDQPRDPHPNFYWLQEDQLRSASAACGCTFTIWRPQVLIGSAPGAAMNPVIPIGAYAAITRERGLPFAMPGGGNGLWELVDAGLLAEAMLWAADAPAAAGQTFNVTNGDQFMLRHAWPLIAASLGLPDQGTAPPSFAEFFAQPVRIAAGRVALRLEK